jgi:hypothetical protein
MPNELTHWLGGVGASERQHHRDLVAADRAEARIEDIGRLTKRATFEMMQVNALRAQAAQIAPDGAELYAMIALAGAVECTRVIGNLYQRGDRR